MKPVADVSHRTAAQRPAPLHTIFITLDFMKRMGVPVDVLLRGTGISPSDVERPNAMVTHAQEMVLFANALEATGNTAIGLHIGNAIPV
ncbi:AraC family transcriptional regulator ligand-binding domain-containing protein, partial [Burkholderia pseudomallei]